MAKQKQDDQLEHTYSSYVRIRDVALMTCQKRWMIGRSGKRGSGISVLVERHDDDDINIVLYIPKSQTKTAYCARIFNMGYEIHNFWNGIVIIVSLFNGI